MASASKSDALKRAVDVPTDSVKVAVRPRPSPPGRSGCSSLVAARRRQGHQLTDCGEDLRRVDGGRRALEGGEAPQEAIGE